MILVCKACGIACLKAYILVSSFAPEREACVDHSWYHSLKGRIPILDVYMKLVDSNSECAGTKWLLKSALKVAHVPKAAGVTARAAACLSRAQSPAVVPILKYVNAEETFFASVSNVSAFKKK